MKIFEILTEETFDTLLSKFPGIHSDLISIGEWMNNSDPHKLSYDLVIEPMTKFYTEAQQMYDTYEEFPNDDRRTKRIIKQLKTGKQQYPIFCDEHNFIMEGRHRIVAFWILKIPTVPVIYVRL